MKRAAPPYGIGSGMDWPLSDIADVRAGSSRRGGLDESEDVPVGITDVELLAVGHDTQRHRKRSAGLCESRRQTARVTHRETGIQMLRSFESRLVPFRPRHAFQMDAATVADHCRIGVLVDELDRESQAIAIVRKRSAEVGHPQHRRDRKQVTFPLIGQRFAQLEYVAFRVRSEERRVGKECGWWGVAD